VFLAAALSMAAGVYYAIRHLPRLAKWALERTFPGATVEMRKLEISFPDRLTAESITLRSRKDGATLLTLAGGSVTFNFSDLRHRQISEVRLVEPVINASPRLPEAFAAPPGSKAKAGAPWTVRRFVCDYGQLNVAGYGSPGLMIQSKFCFDLKNFAISNAPAEPHELVLWDVTAATHADPPFLRLDLVRARFDLEALIKRQTVSALAVEGGSLIFGKSLRELFSPPKDDSAQASTAQPSWILGSLDIKRVAVRLEDERPQVSDITFALNSSLKNVPLSKGASALGSEQQLVEIANLEVLSPLDPFTKVLTLDSIFVRFTLAGLLRREIDSLTILGPNIFLGEDLFWYMDDMQCLPGC
jgi:hypothetical protein